MPYEFHTTLDLPFEAALEKVRAALMDEHLGIVSDVDVQAIFRDKLRKETPAYHIFGACNPKLADEMISEEPNIGTLLPCTFVMRETGDGRTLVSFMDPVPVLGLSDAPSARRVAEDAKARLERVVAALSG